MEGQRQPRFSLATNFDDALVEQVSGTAVDELYGKLSADVVGGGRASYQVAGIGRRRLQRHVRQVRDAGMHFNYLLNGACTDNLECTRSGQRSVRNLLDWLVDIGVERVTVASPHLLRMVKERCSWLHVRISVFAGVDHVRKARMWEDMGADRIALDSLLVNREFDLLAAIRRSVSCDLELLVNNSCLQSCSMSPHHMNTLAHASQSQHRARTSFVDWCFLRCTRMRLEDPIHFIRADWIRPEDLHRYEALGYSNFKLVERAAPTGVLVARVRAYSARRWDGNLLDLVQPYGFPRSLAGSAPRRRGLLWLLRYFLRPSLSNTRRTLKLRRLAQSMSMLDARDEEPPVFIDNRLLDGFMDRFEERGCRDTDCDTCGYCAKWARRAVRMNPAVCSQALQLHNELLNDLESG